MMKRNELDKALDEALAKAPEIKFKPGFADSIVASIHIGELREHRKFLLLKWVASFLFVVSALGVLLFFGGISQLKILLDYGSWITFIVLVFTLVQYLDSRLVRPRSTKLTTLKPH